ncbi:EamA/RhaT family transporter [Leptospira semungkisensis]|uniref:EamA/RhaT family transporter n=1 Tax=Leptospira semungkisensis TaxID=2484985 RepID=A0A4V3JAQ4_9LEPT|nr:DMT family transporter [Leptospira semungkisensis]TGJ99418.1 EamA/RhaT family transporter [Leptospira semungkisensis]
MQENRLRTYLEFQLSQILISGNVLFAQLLSYSPSMINWGRTLFSFILLGLVLYIRKRPFFFPTKKENLISLALGVVLAVHWVTFFASAQKANIAIAVLTLFTHPVWTVLLEPLFFPSRVKVLDLGMALLVFFGMWILVPSFDLNNSYMIAVSLGLISSLCMAFRNLLTKKYLSSHGSTQVIFHQTLVTCFLLSPVLFFEPIFSTTRDWSLIILLGVFLTAIGHTFYIKAVFRMKVKTAGLLSTVQPVYSAILAWLILGEVPRKEEFIGGGFILLAACIETLRYQKKTE